MWQGHLRIFAFINSDRVLFLVESVTNSDRNRCLSTIARNTQIPAHVMPEATHNRYGYDLIKHQFDWSTMAIALLVNIFFNN